jgi:hypothetical protein
MRTSFLRLGMLAALVAALSACVKEPEGPAQRIGRSIDEISKSMRDIGDDWDRERRDQERADAERREREERYQRGSAYDYDRRPVPERDPYYDTPPNDSYRDNEYRDDYRRDRY